MKSASKIRSAERLVTIIESFLKEPSQSLSEISIECGLEPSTTARYLHELLDRGWLDRDARTLRYSLGLRLLKVGDAARSSRPVRKVVLPHMVKLLQQFDETVNFAVHGAVGVVVVESLESSQSVRRGAAVGDRDDWFVSSLGKSIMAHLPADEVDELLRSRDPVRHTPHTIMTRKAMLAELEAIRARGYALDDEESELGLKCVAVSIQDERGLFSCALSISGPTFRIDYHLDDIVSALTEVASTVNQGGFLVPNVR